MLVRHGESTWVAEGRFQGRGDPPLSSLGRRQAELVALRLADPGSELPLSEHPPSGIWHSPLQRAATTAEAIAAARHPPPPLRSSDGLSEIDQGEWQGLTHDQVRGRWASTLEAWRDDPTSAQAPGGERLLDAQLRVREALDEIVAAFDPAERPDSQTVSAGTAVPWAIIVAHDGVLRLALMALLGVPITRFWSFPFVLCGISVVEIAEGRTILRAHNVAGHLAPLLTLAKPPHDRRGAL
ncbi:MAG: histidine phosphatase family protein [Candidatus Limnocylindrales bacterium]